MQYYIDWQKYSAALAFPKAVSEKYMKLASGDYIKILLYIIANDIFDSNFTADIAKNCGSKISEETVEDAFSFWNEVGVLSAKNGDNSIAVAEKTQDKSNTKSLTSCESIVKFIPAKEIAERISSSSEIAFILGVAEKTFAKILNHTEQRTLIFIYDYYAFTPDLIIMMIEFCKSIDRLNIAYIEKIAKDVYNLCKIRHLFLFQ